MRFSVDLGNLNLEMGITVIGEMVDAQFGADLHTLLVDQDLAVTSPPDALLIVDPDCGTSSFTVTIDLMTTVPSAFDIAEIVLDLVPRGVLVEFTLGMAGLSEEESEPLDLVTLPIPGRL